MSLVYFAVGPNRSCDMNTHRMWRFVGPTSGALAPQTSDDSNIYPGVFSIFGRKAKQDVRYIYTQQVWRFVGPTSGALAPQTFDDKNIILVVFSIFGCKVKQVVRYIHSRCRGS